MVRNRRSLFGRSIAGLTMLVLVFQALMVAAPAGAAGLKMDTPILKANATFTGELKADYSGMSVANAGDVNGDGYDDMVIGAPRNDDGGNDAGQVYIILGGPSGWTTGVDLGKVDASYRGAAADDYAGYSVAGAGDVNGDGYDDILIGAYGNDDATTDGGQAYLIFGMATGWSTDLSLAKSADASFLGTENGEAAGFSVAGAGDVNGDGYGDMLIGAYLNDINGADSGRTYLFLGKQNGLSTGTKVDSADASYDGIYDNDYSGYSVAGAGDVNRDGYDDFLIGAPMNSITDKFAGASFLVFGRAAGWSYGTNLMSADVRFEGELADDQSGTSVAGAGDVNGDGYCDILIGALMSDCDGARPDAGQTYLWFGRASGWAPNYNLGSSDASFWGEDVKDRSGLSVSGAADVNGDGYCDFLIGAPFNAGGGSERGQTYVVLGRSTGFMMDMDLTLVAGASFLGELDSDYSGYSVAGGGDMNGDGHPDLVIGAPNFDIGADEGKIYALFMFSLPPIPNGLTATTASDASQINLAWSDADTWPEPISAYRVYRSMDGTNYKHIGTAFPGNLNFADANVVQGKTYYYAVVTVDGTGALSEMSETASATCDVDTDKDGLPDGVDPDDDGDNIPDFSDAFPLDSKEWLDTDADGLGNNKDTDDDNDGVLDVQDGEPLNPLNIIHNDVKFINTTLGNVHTEVTAMMTDVALMNGNLTAFTADFALFKTSVTDALGSVQSDIAGMNGSLHKQVQSLSTELDAVNRSLRNAIAGLEQDISDFQSETAATLAQIINMLAQHDRNLTKEISGLNRTMNQLAATSLKQITDQLTAIENRLRAMGDNDTVLLAKISELKADIGTFRTDTGLGLQNLSTQMVKLDTIQESINALQKSQRTTTNNVEALGSREMVPIGLMVVLLVISVIILVLGRRKQPPAA